MASGVREGVRASDITENDTLLAENMRPVWPTDETKII